MESSRFESLTLVAAVVGVAVLGAGSHAIGAALGDIAILLSLFAFDGLASRSGAQSIAFAGVSAFCLLTPLFFLANNVLGATPPSDANPWLLFGVWAAAALVLFGVDRFRMSALENVSLGGAGLAGSAAGPIVTSMRPSSYRPAPIRAEAPAPVQYQAAPAAPAYAPPAYPAAAYPAPAYPAPAYPAPAYPAPAYPAPAYPAPAYPASAPEPDVAPETYAAPPPPVPAAAPPPIVATAHYAEAPMGFAPANFAAPVAAPVVPPAPDVTAIPAGRESLIYLNLVGEGLNVLRTVRAENLGRDYYRIADIMPQGEQWEFTPGQVVKCRKKSLSNGKHMVAYEEAPRA